MADVPGGRRSARGYEREVVGSEKTTLSFSKGPSSGPAQKVGGVLSKEGISQG